MRPSKMLHNSEILRVSKAKAPLRKAGIVHRPHARPEAKLAMIHAMAMFLRHDVFHCSKRVSTAKHITVLTVVPSNMSVTKVNPNGPQ